MDLVGGVIGILNGGGRKLLVYPHKINAIYPYKKEKNLNNLKNMTKRTWENNLIKIQRIEKENKRLFNNNEIGKNAYIELNNLAHKTYKHHIGLLKYVG